MGVSGEESVRSEQEEAEEESSSVICCSRSERSSAADVVEPNRTRLSELLAEEGSVGSAGVCERRRLSLRR